MDLKEVGCHARNWTDLEGYSKGGKSQLVVS